MTSTFKTVFFHVIFPLLVGSFIYIGFRNSDLRLFHWFNRIGISNLIDTVKAVTSDYRTYLPQWIIYSLPDGLWAYSFSSAYLILWRNDFKNARYWLMLSFGLTCIIELCQGIGIIKGTFDIVDLSVSFLFILLSIQFFNQSLFKYEKNKIYQNH